MGARGPKPKATNLKILEGNPGKRPLNADETQPEAGAVCPDWLPDEAKEQWDYLAPILESCGILTKADVPLLASFCDSWANYVRASKQVEILNSMPAPVDPQLDLFGGSVQKAKIHPVKLEQRNYAELVLKFGAKLGLSPSDRTNIKVSGKSNTQSKWTNKITG